MIDLRDYFAARVMQGMMLNANPYREHTRDAFAKLCYEMADAMLKVRNE